MRYLILVILFVGFKSTQAQELYKLRDPAKDSLNFVLLYDSLPVMSDSFYLMFQRQKLTGVKKFVPEVKYLRATFDTLAIEYSEQQVIYRQQMLFRNLQKTYKKILKRAEQNKVKIKKLEKLETEYEYGEDKNGHVFCYVTTKCERRKHLYELRYLAIRLNNKWFVGDELKFEKI